MATTDSTKINCPAYNIRMYWTNFRQPTAHVQQDIFGKTLIKICSYIFTLLLAPFASKLVNYSRHSESLKYVWKSTNRSHRRKMSSISEFFIMFKDSLCRDQLTNFDAKGAKRSVKMCIMCNTNSFLKNISAVKNSFSAYVCYNPDGLFWLNLYQPFYQQTVDEIECTMHLNGT